MRGLLLLVAFSAYVLHVLSWLLSLHGLSRLGECRIEDDEPEEDFDEQLDEDGGDMGGEMESEVIDDPTGGMTAEGRKRQRRQTTPYMTKYERARILG